MPGSSPKSVGLHFVVERLGARQMGWAVHGTAATSARTARCSKHPLRALWTAHRHLKEPSTSIRVASLVLASEALWWLGHFEDARIAAEAAAEADPKSAQARWRLAVALYRRGRFSESAKSLDDLLRLVNRFGPAWALRGQVKVWLDPDNRDAGRSDFIAAVTLNSDSGTWVVPYRMERDDFEARVAEEIRILNSEVVGSSGVFTDVEWLPEKSRVENGVDPDRRWHLPAVSRQVDAAARVSHPPGRDRGQAEPHGMLRRWRHHLAPPRVWM